MARTPCFHAKKRSYEEFKGCDLEHSSRLLLIMKAGTSRFVLEFIRDYDLLLLLLLLFHLHQIESILEISFEHVVLRAPAFSIYSMLHELDTATSGLEGN